MLKKILIFSAFVALLGAGCGTANPIQEQPPTNTPPVNTSTTPDTTYKPPADTAEQTACRASTVYKQFYKSDGAVGDERVAALLESLPQDVRDKAVLLNLAANNSGYTTYVFLTCGPQDSDAYKSYVVVSRGNENKLIAQLPSFTTSNSAHAYSFAFWLGDSKATQFAIAANPYGFGAGGSCQDVPYVVFDAVSGKELRKVALTQRALLYAQNSKAVDTDNPCVVGNKIYGVDMTTGKKTVVKQGGEQDIFYLDKIIVKQGRPYLQYAMNGENTVREIALP